MQEKFVAEKQHIKHQVVAEAAFGEIMEAHGMDPIQFMKQWKLSHHQFNTLAHYVHGVNDEEPMLPSAIKALLLTIEKSLAA